MFVTFFKFSRAARGIKQTVTQISVKSYLYFLSFSFIIQKQFLCNLYIENCKKKYKDVEVIGQIPNSKVTRD